jgi:hypothetical protein
VLTGVKRVVEQQMNMYREGKYNSIPDEGGINKEEWV